MQIQDSASRLIAAFVDCVAKPSWGGLFVLNLRMDGLRDNRSHCRSSVLITRVVLERHEMSRYTIRYPRKLQIAAVTNPFVVTSD